MQGPGLLGLLIMRRTVALEAVADTEGKAVTEAIRVAVAVAAMAVPVAPDTPVAAAAVAEAMAPLAGLAVLMVAVAAVDMVLLR